MNVLNKKARHELIKKIIEDHIIHRQEDLVAALEKKGLDITQATISRDMKELALVKVPLEEGGYRYSLPDESTTSVVHRLEGLLKDSFVSIDSQNEMILIKTIPGSGEALAGVLQSDEFEQIFAVISNDDNILIICRDDDQAEELRNQLLRYI